METTAVNVREEARAFALPGPRSRRDLVARVSAGFLAGAIPATGFAVWALLWSAQSPYRTALGQLAVGVALLLIFFLWLSLSESLRPATPKQLEHVERLAHQHTEVRRYLRSLCDLSRPILAADVIRLLQWEAKLKASADAIACAAQTEALQIRIRALVGAQSRAPDRSMPAASTAPGLEA